MREIKFRAWNGVDWLCLDEWPINDIPIDGVEFMQYTGIKDCDGVELYEGDVVHIAGYGDYLCEFPFIELYESSYEGDVEKLIGNIYETPELLKEES